MIGSVVENLSNRKLFGLLIILLVTQLGFFLIGGIIAPQPTSSMDVLMTKCIVPSSKMEHGLSNWSYLHPRHTNCKEVGRSLLGGDNVIHASPNQLVFVAQIPHIRENHQLAYTPWFQFLLGVLMPQISHDPLGRWLMAKNPKLLFDVRLGYRNKGDPPHAWKELVHTQVSRKLDCTIDDEHLHSEASYNCTPIELFELGSNDYPYYLLNIRMPIVDALPDNQHIGRWDDLYFVAIHQNGGFTKVWISLKTFVTPIIIFAVYWYWRRVLRLPRQPLLLEKSIFVLGVTMTCVNLPIEWLSLVIRMPFMLLLSDIRSGIFYATLASFWLIFTGEHLVGESQKNSLSHYWKQLTAVLLASGCMFIFDLCERGMHLKNPFYSIWSSDLGANLAYAFIIVAAICSVLYFIYLLYLVIRVLLSIRKTRSSFQHLNRRRKLTYEAIIYRFKFLMIATILCAALTVALYMMQNIGEGQLHWGDFEDAPMLHYSSAFHTGVFGMWNIYVFILLALYAPSHKQYESSIPLEIVNDDDLDGDPSCPIDESYLMTSSMVDSGRLEQTEPSVMTAMMKTSLE